MAVRTSYDEDVVVALAQYEVFEPFELGLAEVAVVVEDAYQGQGLGSFLCGSLAAHARAHGIKAFTCDVHCMNSRMLHLISRSGLNSTRRRQKGVIEIRVDLASGHQSNTRQKAEVER